MIRASGGKAVVVIRKRSYRPGSIREYVLRRVGPWAWEIPVPKGHPRTPKRETLHGYSRTQQGALRMGLDRLTEVYGGKP